MFVQDPSPSIPAPVEPAALALRRHGPQTRPLRLARRAALGLVVWLAPSAAFGDTVFRHVADAGNTFLFESQISHPELDGDPDAIFVVTHVFDPAGGLVGTNNEAPIGVRYTASDRWAINNQDLSAIALGTVFNIWIPGPDTPAFVVETGSIVPSSNILAFSHPSTDNNLDALVFVTYNRNPGGGTGPLWDHYLRAGRSFIADTEDFRATIVNQDGEFMVSGLHFNVAVKNPSDEAFRHVADAGNTSGDLTRLAREGLDDVPTAVVFATQFQPLINPNNDHPTGVIYDLFNGQWAVYNEDTADIPLGSQWSIFHTSDGLFADGFETGNVSAWGSSIPPVP